MAYKYQVYTRDKKIVQGTIEVTSEGSAEAALYRAGYQYIISLEELPPKLNLERLLPTIYGVKTQEVIDFSNQLATMIESGINLLTSLQLLGGQTSKKSMQKIIAGLVEEIQGGNSLSETLTHFPETFPDTYCKVVKASEQAGRLETGLRQAALSMEKQMAAKRKIRRAMTYPIFIMLMAVGVTILLITVALPPLADLFKSIGAELPAITRVLIGISDFFFNNIVSVIVGVVAFVIFTVLLLRVPSVKLIKDNLMLKLPIIGGINIERSIQHLCQTVAMLLSAGLHLPQIMEIAIQTNRNQIIKRTLSGVRERLIQGEGLSQPLLETDIFPPLLAEMVAVGEKTGAMDSTFATLTDFYEQKVDRRIDTLISMIEPVMTLVIGVVVVFITLSMITPLYSILNSMH